MHFKIHQIGEKTSVFLFMHTNNVLSRGGTKSRTSQLTPYKLVSSNILEVTVHNLGVQSLVRFQNLYLEIRVDFFPIVQ